MGMIKHTQITQSNKFAISLQCLSGDVHFLHAYKHQSFYKLTLSFLMEVARYVQISRVLLLWCKIFRYFLGVQSCLLLLVKTLESGVKIFWLSPPSIRNMGTWGQIG